MAKKEQNLDQSLDLNKFQDLGGFTSKKLNLGLWIVSHRRYFITGTIVLLIALSAAFYGYTIYSYIDYYFFGGQVEKQNIAELTNMNVLSDTQKLKALAQKLIDYPPQVFFNNCKYDFLVKVTNPNDRLFANFSYCFLSNSATTTCGTTLILPSETKYLTALGVKLDNPPGNLGLNINNVAWQRLNAHNYPDWPSFSQAHLNFTLGQTEFKSAAASGLSEKLNINTLQFNFTNNSAFSYWEAPLTIILFEGADPVGVTTYTLDQFLSGQTQAVKLTWVDDFNQISDVKVLPNINIMDDSIYMKYQ